MPLDTQSTTLRLTPYFDDYDETKNFHRVLFKPSVAVQARELTQLQTILQGQIERFGDNIFKTGTIIKGCSLTTDDQYYYVKLFDLQTNGTTYTLSSLVNTYVTDLSSNLTALAVNYKTGGQQTDPDLNTLYLKYLNTGTGGEKQFSNNATLTIFNRDYRVESVSIANGGTLYANSDTLIFTAANGSGAVAGITTFANGTIRSIDIEQQGVGYITAPTVTVNTSTGTGASLIATNYLAQIAVANNLYTAPVGRGYAIKTSEGIIYQKGHFIRVGEHEEVVSKYNTSPTGVVVGFATTESIVNSNADSTLLDNANNSTNFTAPGADRLKLTANLVVLTTAAASSNNDFLALYEFENGRVVKDRTSTQFNSVNTELSKRTFEESGNYVVDQIPLYTEAITSNTTHLNLVVGAGLAYIEGNRVQIFNNTKIPVRKSTNTAVDDLQTISTSYGGFVYVKELLGNFDIKNGAQVTLRDTAATDVTDNAGGSPTAPGTQIGTARVRSIEYDSGVVGTPSATYRLYLFDVTMSQGRSFKDVRSVAISGAGIADVVLNSYNEAQIVDQQFDSLIFSTGTTAVQELTNETFTTRSQTNAAFSLGGSLTVSFSGGNTLPYTPGSTLTSTQEREFIIVPQNTLTSSTNKTGTVAVTSGANTVTGTGTLFTTEYIVGQFIKVGSQNPALITRIVGNTSIQVATNFGSSLSAQTHTISYPANVPINFQDDPTKSISIDGTGTTLTLNLGHGLTAGTLTTSIYHDIQSQSPAVKVKSVANSVFVKLSTTLLSATNNGPWCLGVPDAFEIKGVYIGSANTYSNTSTNFASEFILDSGQNDNYYGLSTLRKNPRSLVQLSNTNCLLVELRAFTHGTGKYISTESYASAVDDVTTPLPSNKIRTQDIPVYTSPKTGVRYDLRDVIDFRPMCSNTANLASTVAGATVDPSTTISFSATEKFFPSTTREFTATINSYQRRIDRVVIDTFGDIKILEGIADNNPSAPPEPRSTMTIGLVNVSPYPSLSAKDAGDSGRPDLGVYVTPLQNKRYTMKDIADIDRRINRLEYYTLLNTLEQSTKELVLPGEANASIERFKNGFFVDPLTDYNISNLQDPAYNIVIDTQRGVARPNSADVKVDLLFDSANSSNVTKTEDLITLNYNVKELISQPIGNKDRTLVEQFWKYKGNVTLIPSFDNYYDINRNATTIAIDVATPLNALAAATTTALSQLNVRTNLDKVVNVGSAFSIGTNGWNEVLQQNIERTITDTKVKILPGQENISVQDLGSFVTDFSLKPYVREQRVHFYASGMRPGATHYVFFDNTNLTSVTTPAAISVFTNVNANSFVAIGARGSSLVANATGEVAGFVDIPGNTFFVGERSVVLMDASDVSSETSATSKAIGNFVAYSYGVNKTNLSIATKTINVAQDGSFEVANYTNTYVVPDKIIFERPVPRPDPISQTFIVQRQLADTDGLFVTSASVYFRRKDPIHGVTLELRETINGVPSHIVVPFSRVRLPSSSVSVSNNASVPTTFTFSSPVYLKTEAEYALVVYPDANSPEYRIWTAETGVADLANNNLISNQNWGLGTLFYSTSGTSWTPVQDEDMKFTINRADFSSLSGTVSLVNGDHEFLSVTGVQGSFRGGERVAQLSTSYLSGTFTTNTSSRVVQTSSNQLSALAIDDNVLLIAANGASLSTGNVNVTGTTVSNGGGQTTSFNVEYANGSFLRIGSEIRQVVAVTNSTSMTIDVPFASSISNGQHYRVTPVYDIGRVLAANSTSITLNSLPKISSNTTVIVNAQKAVVAVVDAYDSANGKIYLASSTAANSTFKFAAANSTFSGLMIGDTSQSLATVASVDNLKANAFKPLINFLQVPGTTVSLTGTFTTNAGSTDTRSYFLTSTNKLSFNDDAVVKSKSNEIVGTTLTKSFNATVSMSSFASDTSPVVDVAPSSVILTRNLINNDVTGETTSYGNASCRYISKRIVLADGMDAEDTKVFLTAYKPAGTEVLVYAKILNGTDGETFDSKGWTLLQQVTSSSVYSDSLDETDYREYEYTFPRTPPSVTLPGVVTTYSNTTIVGTDTNFTSTLIAGDLIKVVKSNTETDYDLVPVLSVANNTQLTVASSISFTGTGNQIERVTDMRSAYKYTRNGYVVRYHDGADAAYDGYKYMAIKVVLLSPYNYLVPILNDVRALAVST